MYATATVLLIVYVSMVLFILAYRHVMKIRFRRAISQDRDREAISIAWAWLTEQEILAAMQYWGAPRFAGMAGHGRPSDGRLLLPHITLAVFVIIMHQVATRLVPGYNKGICRSTPNCSNYVIGIMRRAGFFLAVSKGHIRVASCGASDRVSFAPDYS